jgi:uncharacterized delta-60 repeat protein
VDGPAKLKPDGPGIPQRSVCALGPMMSSLYRRLKKVHPDDRRLRDLTVKLTLNAGELPMSTSSPVRLWPWSVAPAGPFAARAERSRDVGSRRTGRRRLRPAADRLEDRTLLALGLPIGAPDVSFNGLGLNTTLVGSNDAVGASALQPDGKIVVAGWRGQYYQSQSAVVIRYLPNGQLDPSFGGPGQPGVVDLGPGPLISAVYAVAVDRNPGSPDLGDIVVTGRWSGIAPQGQLGDVALARLKPDGSLDAGFGTGGVVVDPSNSNTEGFAVAIQTDDKIVVLTTATDGAAMVERFNSDGTTDPSFGAAGMALPFGDSTPNTGAMAQDPNGNILVARVENANSSPATIEVARLTAGGQPDTSFGSQGIASTTVAGSRVPYSGAAGLGIDRFGRIMIAGTAVNYAGNGPRRTPSSYGYWVVCFNHSGYLDPSFDAVNEDAVDFVDLPASPEFAGTTARGVAVQPDGQVVLGGINIDERGPLQNDVNLVRLNPDGTLDESFGERGLDVPIIGSQVSGYLSSVLVQPDGNVVTAFTYSPGQPSAGSEFGVARYRGDVGANPPNSGTIPAGIYSDDFVGNGGAAQPTLDSSPVFQHFLWYNDQPSTDPLHAASGHGWDLEVYLPAGTMALHEVAADGNDAALDAITFPNLRPDVHVGLASVDVSAVEAGRVTFVGTNGSYTVDVPAGTITETVAAGESHVLEGTLLNPTLELGPIRAVILDAQNAFFYNLKVLVIPGQGPLDDFVTVAPDTATAIGVLDYATGLAAAAGLQPPLEFLDPPGQPSLPGSQTAISSTNRDIVYTNTVVAQPGRHPTDSFTYTVLDVNQKTATGTVYINIDAPPVFDVTVNSPAVAEADGWAFPHGTTGPLTGLIDITDPEQDPVTLTVTAQPLYGTLSLRKVSDSQHSFSYAPPTTYAYNDETGVSTAVSVINGDDQFSLRASDGFSTTDYTVAFHVPDDPPYTAPVDPDTIPAASQFVVPENVGVSYYLRADVQPGNYDRSIDFPGLVHFAAPGVLWNQVDVAALPTSSSHGELILDPLVAVLAAPPQHGLLYLLPDGSFNYTPKRGFVGTDTFAFYASNGYVATQPAEVEIHVVRGTKKQPYLNAPVLRDVHYSLVRAEPQRFDPPVFGKVSADFSQFTILDKLLIRPDSPAGYNSGVLQIGLIDLTKVLALKAYARKTPAGAAFKNDLSLFYNALDFTLYLDRSDDADLGIPDELGFDLATINFGGGADVFVSKTLALANARGWLSNFASIVVRVSRSAAGR